MHPVHIFMLLQYWQFVRTVEQATQVPEFIVYYDIQLLQVFEFVQIEHLDIVFAHNIQALPWR